VNGEFEVFVSKQPFFFLIHPMNVCTEMIFFWFTYVIVLNKIPNSYKDMYKSKIKKE